MIGIGDVHILFRLHHPTKTHFQVLMKQPSPIRLVTRTRNKWKHSAKHRSASDNATALGYIIWQLALGGAKKLHEEDFRYDCDDQRILVIEEYMAFLVHLADRMSFSALTDQERRIFVSSVARAAARHLQRNKEEIICGSAHGEDFLDRVNQRSQEYACCSFQGEPGYHMRRALGAHIQDVMGSDQTNKWVLDQVVEIDTPDLCKQLRASIDNLTSTG